MVAVTAPGEHDAVIAAAACSPARGRHPARKALLWTAFAATGLLPGCRSVPAAAPPAPRPGAAGTPIETGTGWGRAGLDGPVPAAGSCHYRKAADGYALPDAACTPGAVDAAVTQADIATTVCRHGYSASVRPPVGLTEPAKFRSMASYDASGPPSGYEYDHLVPLGLGGSSDVRNLWAEPDQGSPGQFDAGDGYGRNAKDGVESRLAAAVCAGRLPLGAAQDAIARDWTTAESVLGIGP